MNISHPIDSDEDLDRAEICQLDANNPVSYVNYLVTRLPLNEYATNTRLNSILLNESFPGKVRDISLSICLIALLLVASGMDTK